MGCLGVKHSSPQRFLVSTQELRNTSLTGKCAFRLAGCLVLSVCLLSRPVFLTLCVSLLDLWGRVTGRPLHTEGSSSYREIMPIISTKHVIFHSNVFKHVMSPVWMQVPHLQLAGSAELAVTVTASEFCQNEFTWDHPATISGIVELNS